jgi:phosphoribosylaminoimidazolecarboxamide formyltransferase/IMP cyclohydrolase
VTARIAVGVSGTGTNLEALLVAAARDELGGRIVQVFADRACPALDRAAAKGIPASVTQDDAAILTALADASVDLVVLAGYMRFLGPDVTSAYPQRIVNTHPSLLPAFPGAHAVRDALARGAVVTGATVHLVDDTLDDGPILLQEAVAVLPDDTEASLHARIKSVEHRLLPRAVALLLAGAIGMDTATGQVRLDPARADTALRPRRRALLSVSDKDRLVAFADGLVELGFELVSTGGTARALRDAGLLVTDVEAITGVPEMLDGRVKTLHPRIHGGILADGRRREHREALQVAGIDRFEVVVVNLYPFREAAAKPELRYDDLVEEIDIGGPSLVRAAAKNHRGGVTIVTSPDRYDDVLATLRAGDRVPDPLRAALAVEAFRHTAAYDARIAAELPRRMCRDGIELPAAAGLPGSEDPYPPVLVLPLEKVDALRYGENPHQAAARYRRVDREAGAADGPFASGLPPLQGKPLSYNNVLDASAAASVARLLRGPAAVVVKHTNACGAAERPNLLEAWRAALAGDPVSAFGGVVALTDVVDHAVAEALTELFLEVVVAPGFDVEAREVLGSKPNLRLVVDDGLGMPLPGATADDLVASIRTAGGAVLVQATDRLDDDPSGWVCPTRREPDESERRDLELAWRLVRGVTSNAIVLVRDGMLIGLGSGQTSRVDACRQAVDKARAIHGEDVVHGAVAASDAFFPFADGPEALFAAGITAVVQPGGSLRDAEVVVAADRAGAAMLVTGTRHFRH